MSLLKSKVGTKSKPYTEEISQDRILAFCRAVGAEEGTVAPPTFMTLFRQGEFSLIEECGLELAKALHTEQEYEYDQAIQAGDAVHYQTEVTQVLEKQGSSYRMQFLTLETEFFGIRDSQKIRMGKAKSTIVFRE